MSELLLLLSLTFNLIAIAFLIKLIFQHHKITHIISQLSLKFKPESRQLPYYSDSYFHRLNQLQSLPLTANDIVFLGDSLTSEGEWSELMNVEIKNRGIGGDTTVGLLNRLDPILASKPRKLFLMIGINDITRSVKVEQIIQNYCAILTQIRTHAPTTQVYIQSLLPVGKHFKPKKTNLAVIELNSQLPDIARQFCYSHVDLFPHFTNEEGELAPEYSQDGLHLNGKAYVLWRHLLEKYIGS